MSRSAKTTPFAAVMRLWKTAPANRARTCHACPELGPIPGGYGLSSFAPSWPDAIRLQREPEARWNAP